MIENFFKLIEANLKKHTISDFELFFEKKLSRTFVSKDLKLESAEESLDQGVALRVFKDQKFSFAYSTDVTSEGLNKLCENVAAMLPLVNPDADYMLPKISYPIQKLELENFDSQFDSTATAHKIQKAIDLEKTTKSYDARIKHVRSTSYDEEKIEQSLWNSAGIQLSHQKTLASLNVMAVAEQNDEAESAYEFDFNSFLAKLNPEAVGKRAAKQAISYLGGKAPKTGKMPAVFSPLVAGEFLSSLASSFKGENLFKKRSFLVGKFDQKLYSPQLNIIDDRTLKGGVSSAPFDGEGQTARRLSLVQGGVFLNCLLDTYYGLKLQKPGNASSVRSGLRKPPAVSFSNLFIKPGSLSDEAIFAEMGSGVYITEVIGMHATDPISGDFSVGAQGFKIERGQVSMPLKKMVIAGNLHQIMKDIQWVGSNSRFYYNLGAPTLGFKEISVSGN